MVKGNWERRAELVASRRLEERALKVSKAAGAKQFASGESVVTKLLRDSTLQSEGSAVVGWLACDENAFVCQSWLRCEKCSQKRCRNRHESNIAHLCDIGGSPDSTTATELLCVGPILIQEIARKDYNKIHFIAVNDTCVYDHLFPDVWSNWSEKRATMQKALNKSELITIVEELSLEARSDEHIAHNSDSAKLGSEEVVIGDNNSADVGQAFDTFFLASENQATAPFCSVIHHVFLLLNGVEAGRLALSSKQMYHQCLKTDIFRLRRREGQAAFMAEQSKAKRIDKKKKAKQANVKKDSKKDAFARGGNSH